jgi:hypothetical protein
MIDIPLGKQICDEYAFGGRFGMEFSGNPYVINIEILFQVVDNALADITERSNEIGKNANGYGHCASSVHFCRCRVRSKFYTGLAAFSKDLPA